MISQTGASSFATDKKDLCFCLCVFGITEKNNKKDLQNCRDSLT